MEGGREARQIRQSGEVTSHVIPKLDNLRVLKLHTLVLFDHIKQSSVQDSANLEIGKNSLF